MCKRERETEGRKKERERTWGASRKCTLDRSQAKVAESYYTHDEEKKIFPFPPRVKFQQFFHILNTFTAKNLSLGSDRLLIEDRFWDLRKTSLPA